MQPSQIIKLSIRLVLLGALLYSLFLKDHTQPPYYDLNVQSQEKLNDNVLLKNGILQQTGYSTEYISKLNTEDVYPAFFGLNWLFKDFKFKQYEKYTYLKDSVLHQVNIQNYRNVIYVDQFSFNFDEKDLQKSEHHQFGINEENSFNSSPFECSENYTIDDVTVKAQLNDRKCIYQTQFSDKQFTTQINLNQQLYEVSPLDQEKSQFIYRQRLMNGDCTDCIAYIESTKANQPYNFSGLTVLLMGKLKNSNDIITITFEEGLQHHENSKQIPHSFKINDKVYKLNPLKIKYDSLNLNNGLTLSTHEKHEQKENQAQITCTTYSSYHIDHNWYLIQKHLFRGLIRGEGWVTSDEGQKFEFDSLYGRLIQLANYLLRRQLQASSNSRKVKGQIFDDRFSIFKIPYLKVSLEGFFRKEILKSLKTF